jgi:hypothetical protein
MNKIFFKILFICLHITFFLFIFTFIIKNQSLLYIILLNFIFKILIGFLFFNVNNSKYIYKKMC